MLAETHFLPFAIEYPDRLIALLIGFALFVFFIWKFVVPTFFTDPMHERAGKIEREQELVAQGRAEFQRAHDEYAAHLRDFEVEARQRIDEAVREAEAARAEIIAESRVSAEAVRRRAQEELERAHTRQRILLRKQIVQTALDAAGQSVIAHSSEAVQRKLIQDFISRAATDGGDRAAALSTAPAAPTATTDTEGA